MMPISSMMPVNMFSGWLLLIVQTGIYVHEGADKERTERTRPDKRTKNKTHAFFFSALNPVLSALSVFSPLLHERRSPPFARPTPRRGLSFSKPRPQRRNVVHAIHDHAVVAEGPPLQHGEPGRFFDGRRRSECECVLRPRTDYDRTLKDNQTVDQRLLPESAGETRAAFDQDRADALRLQMFQLII